MEDRAIPPAAKVGSCAGGGEMLQGAGIGLQGQFSHPSPLGAGSPFLSSHMSGNFDHCTPRPGCGGRGNYSPRSHTCEFPQHKVQVGKRISPKAEPDTASFLNSPHPPGA